MIPDGVLINEGNTKILVPCNHSIHGPGKVSGSIFFNEQMSFNRDISIMFLRAIGKSITVSDAMTATGSRAVRIANEVPGTHVVANDVNAFAMPYVDTNIKINNLLNCVSSNKNMHALYIDHTFDYVDVDPFGSPVPFIQSAIMGCRKNGILAITATDTAPLAGANAAKCRRRYQSEPIRGYMCHEGGLRILMCTIAKELAKFNRGMRPLLSFYADHYFRTYIQIMEGANAADKTLDQLGYMSYNKSTMERSISIFPDIDHHLGQFWLGPLYDAKHLSKMKPDRMQSEKRCAKYLDLWRNEIDTEVFIYDMDELSSHTKMSPPRIDHFMEILNENGRASRSHMSPTSFKTDLCLNDVVSLYKEHSPDSYR